MTKTAEERILEKLGSVETELARLRAATVRAADESLQTHEAIRRLPCCDGQGCPYRQVVEREVRAVGGR